MSRVRLWIRGEGSSATLAEQPRDTLDLVEVLEQECAVTSVLIVCTQHTSISQTGNWKAAT